MRIDNGMAPDTIRFDSNAGTAWKQGDCPWIIEDTTGKNWARVEIETTRTRREDPSGFKAWRIVNHHTVRCEMRIGYAWNVTLPEWNEGGRLSDLMRKMTAWVQTRGVQEAFSVAETRCIKAGIDDRFIFETRYNHRLSESEKVITLLERVA